MARAQHGPHEVEIWSWGALGSATDGTNAGFVFDGYIRFWQVADLLLRDIEPSQVDWQRLLSAPGYQELAAHEFQADFLPDLFRLAFNPSLGAALARALQGGPLARHLAHLLEAERAREDLAREIEFMCRLPLAAAALDAAHRWLPRRAQTFQPEVAFVIFGPDARAFGRVVLDASFFFRLPHPHLLLAHEYHHVLRRALEPTGDYGLGDADAFFVFSQLEREGIADQIDKRQWPDPMEPVSESLAHYQRVYRRSYTAAPAALHQLDRLLGTVAARPAERSGLGRQLRAWLQLEGHPVGSFMARAIELAFGREQLVELVGDPLGFLRAYSKAAASTRQAPPLGENALRILDLIERNRLRAAADAASPGRVH